MRCDRPRCQAARVRVTHPPPLYRLHKFSRRLCRLPLFCKATGQLLAHMISHGYVRCKLCIRVKRFLTRGMPGSQPNADGCSTGLDSTRWTRSHSTIRNSGIIRPILQTRSDLTCFIARQAAGSYMLIVCYLGDLCTCWSTDGCNSNTAVLPPSREAQTTNLVRRLSGVHQTTGETSA